MAQVEEAGQGSSLRVEMIPLEQTAAVIDSGPMVMVHFPCLLLSVGPVTRWLAPCGSSGARSRPTDTLQA